MHADKYLLSSFYILLFLGDHSEQKIEHLPVAYLLLRHALRDALKCEHLCGQNYVIVERLFALCCVCRDKCKFCDLLFLQNSKQLLHGDFLIAVLDFDVQRPVIIAVLRQPNC